MKVYDAYRLAIETGIDNDPRRREDVDALLSEEKDRFEKLSDLERECYDQERLWNPYADSRFLACVEESKDIEADRLMWGIDIDSAEMLLADRLRERGKGVSAVVAHHPIGMARTPFPEVMAVQADMFHSNGVPINVAENLVKGRMDEVLKGVMGSNYNRPVDTANILGVPLFNLHSPADNMVQRYLDNLFEIAQPKYLEDILNALLKEPEYVQASKYNDPPKIIVGSKKGRCGKVISKMTGGTSGPKEIYEKLSQAGVGTVVGMHFPENHIEEAKKNQINVIIAGHMSSDSLGINLICDVWESKGIETIGCSGFTRFSRN